MRIVKKIKLLQSLSRKAKREDKRIGFVPTMGALHEGHLSLIRKAARENDVVVLSIFVNPKQFGPGEDFKSYPRPEKKDILLAKKEPVDIIFYPSGNEMYPEGFLTRIEVERVTEGLCGSSRPGHFRGVTTVVGKLLNIVSPDVIYLGQKDAQQAAVLKRVVRDLNFPVTVKVCPTVREPDGLARSSRNSYLTPKQRSEAVVLYGSLKDAKMKILAGERQPRKINQRIRSMIEKSSSGKIDYIACVDPETLVPLKQIHDKVMVALAVRFGQTRLIDNMTIHIS
jgi:pantoate--beta-alanine ligase